MMEQPTFIIDPEADAEAVQFLTSFYDTIVASPEDVKKSVSLLAGKLALGSTVQKPAAEISDMTVQYFSNKYDREVEFDPSTINALSKNEEYLRLIEALRTAENMPIANGNTDGANESRKRRLERIIDNRQDVAFYSLIFFIDQVSEWEAQTQTQIDLPEAS